MSTPFFTAPAINSFGPAVFEEDMANLPCRCKSAIANLRIPISILDMAEETIGNRIRSLRQRLNVTQSQVEKATGIPQSNLSEFENGKLTPTIQTLSKIARFFDVSISYLLGESNVDGVKMNVRMLDGLSEDGKKEIQDFIDFVMNKEKNRR